MDESTALRQEFDELHEQLASVDDADLLEVFVDAREAGLVSKGLDEWINRLRQGEATADEARQWVAEVASGEHQNGDDSGLHELSRPSSVEIAQEPDSSAVDFALVGESMTTDDDDIAVEDDEERVVVETDEASEPSEPGEPPSSDSSEHEESDDNDDDDDRLFDDIGNMMEEAGKRALEEVKDFKLPKLKATKKLSLSGDAREKLSKRFSIPNPTRDVPAISSKSQDVEEDHEANETPFAGLKSLQGLVANSKRLGKNTTAEPDSQPSPDEDESSDGDDIFGFDSLDVDELVNAAANAGESADSEVSGSEPLDLTSRSDAEEEAALSEEAGRENVGGLDFGLDFGDEGSPQEDDGPDDETGTDEAGAEASASEADDRSDIPRDAVSLDPSPGMGSLFDEDELAEIEGAGKSSSNTGEGSGASRPGKRYDSGKSGARYAGKAPPPPTHRLRSGGTSGPSMTGFSVEDEEEDDDDDFDLDFGLGGTTGDSFGTPATEDESSGAEADEEDDDFEFDLGLKSPDDHESGSPGVPLGQESSVQEDDEFDFDLGFDNPAARSDEVGGFELDFDESSAAMELAEDSRGVTRGPPGIMGESARKGSTTEEREDYDELRRKAVRSDVVGEVDSRREYQPTPLRHDAIQRPERVQHPTPIAQDRSGGAGDIDDEEFDELYDSFDSAGGQYRGEPMVREPSEPEELEESRGSGNPFAHEAPTGVHHAAVESSFVLEEVSAAEDGAGPNLAAILLEARRLYENGSFEQSMDIVQKVISRQESDEAIDLKHAIEGELERKELDKLGSLAKVPNLKVSMNDIASLDLDHRAGFLLSQIDGMMAFEDLLELSSMSRYETLTVLTDLLEKDVITVD